jgi:hypothetical protein
VLKKIFIGFSLMLLSWVMLSCQRAQELNTNANTAETVRTAPDNSEITTTTDNSGTRTETRVFRDNPRVSKVVVTTRNGQRTVKVYSRSGEEREMKSEPEKALDATGDAIADSVGFAAEKTETAVDKTKEGTGTAVEKTGETAKTVGEKTTETAKTVGAKSTNTAKTVAEKTKAGAKKTSSTIKRIVTP